MQNKEAHNVMQILDSASASQELVDVNVINAWTVIMVFLTVIHVFAIKMEQLKKYAIQEVHLASARRTLKVVGAINAKLENST